MNLEEKIRKMMQDAKVAVECIEREPVYTNPAMAIALGVKESQTVKSLVLKTKEGKFAVLVLPGAFKVKAWGLGKLCNPYFKEEQYERIDFLILEKN